MLAGKTEAYVYFPQQLSAMESEALQGEIAVWLLTEIVNQQHLYLQLFIIRWVTFSCRGKYSAPNMMTEKRQNGS